MKFIFFSNGMQRKWREYGHYYYTTPAIIIIIIIIIIIQDIRNKNKLSP